MLDPAIAARLKRDQPGLVPILAQQYDTVKVLMLGWMDHEAARVGPKETVLTNRSRHTASHPRHVNQMPTGT